MPAWSTVPNTFIHCWKVLKREKNSLKNPLIVRKLFFYSYSHCIVSIVYIFHRRANTIFWKCFKQLSLLLEFVLNFKSKILGLQRWRFLISSKIKCTYALDYLFSVSFHKLNFRLTLTTSVCRCLLISWSSVRSESHMHKNVLNHNQAVNSELTTPHTSRFEMFSTRNSLYIVDNIANYVF